MFDKEAMLRRAKERGGTASMIVCSVCHDAKNSDIRADNPALLNAFNERFEYLESQRDELLKALKFVHEHIGDPERGFRDLYPAFGLDASRALEMVSNAISKAEGR